MDSGSSPSYNRGDHIPLVRSIAKSLTWRVIGLVLLGGLAWAFTGDLVESLAITIAFNGIRVFLYVAHEEIWERWPSLANFGRIPRGDRRRDSSRGGLEPAAAWVARGALRASPGGGNGRRLG